MEAIVPTIECLTAPGRELRYVKKQGETIGNGDYYAELASFYMPKDIHIQN